jgi:uncharacterized peroxidase-related enzyme
MSWIETIDEADATGELADLYADIIDSRGKLSNILKVHSLHPAALEAHLDLYDALLFSRSPLRRAEREAIAVVVSAANGCDYCVRHHAEALRAYWKDDDRLARFAEDFRQVDDLDPKLRAACAYAERLTRSPDGTGEDDVQALRDAGWSDRAVLDVTLITAYFNFVNRVANGLGVAFTEEEATGYNY